MNEKEIEKYQLFYSKLVNLQYGFNKINFCEGYICSKCPMNSKFFQGCEVDFFREKIKFIVGKLEKIIKS